MKQFKPVLISAAILVVISVAVFCVMSLLPEKTTEGSEIPEVVADDAIMIFDYESNDVISIEFSGGAEKSFIVDYTEKAVGKGATMRDADPRLLYDEYQMTTLPMFLSKLSAFEEIGKEDASLFGFDNPQRKITLVFSDGRRETLLIGDNLPVGDGVYVKRASDDTIYTVGRTTTERLMTRREEFLSYTLFAPIEKIESFTEVEYTEYGKAPIKIAARSEKDIKTDLARMGFAVDFELLSPVKALTNPSVIGELFLDRILEIEGVRVCEESPADLSKYGLDKPTKLKFSTNTGISASILIGASNPVGGSYVMLEGVPAVIETLSVIDFEGLKHTDIALRLVFFFNSNELDSLEYTLASGESHKLRIELEEHLVRGSYDGKKLSGRNAANLFQRTIRFALAGAVEADAKYDKPEVTITANLLNGRKSTLALYKLNERQYAAEVDGKRAEFYVPVSEVRELLDAFEMIKNGEDIPDMF